MIRFRRSGPARRFGVDSRVSLEIWDPPERFADFLALDDALDLDCVSVAGLTAHPFSEPPAYAKRVANHRRSAHDLLVRTMALDRVGRECPTAPITDGDPGGDARAAAGCSRQPEA
jgi:hypothetical protein